MTDFADKLTKFAVKAEGLTLDAFTGAVDLAFKSVVEGDPLTGAPGQPVQTGNLKSSWQKTYTSKTEAEIITNTIYAQPIEEGIGPHGPLTLKSEVGGFHSVGLTVAGWQKIVDASVKANQ